MLLMIMDLLYWRICPHTKDNGMKIWKKDWEPKFGKTGTSIRGIGRIIRLMEKEDLYKAMEIFLKAIGLIIKWREMEFMNM